MYRKLIGSATCGAWLVACGQLSDVSHQDFYLSVGECLSLYKSCSCTLTTEEQLTRGIEIKTFGDFAAQLAASSTEFPGARTVTKDEIVSAFDWETKIAQSLPDETFCVAGDLDDYFEVGPPSNQFIQESLLSRKKIEDTRGKTATHLDNINTPEDEGVFLVDQGYSLEKIELSGKMDRSTRAIVHFEDLPQQLVRNVDISSFDNGKLTFDCLRIAEDAVIRISISDLRGIHTRGAKVSTSLGIRGEKLEAIKSDGYVHGNYCSAPLGFGVYAERENERLNILTDKVERGDILILSKQGRYSMMDIVPTAVVVIE